MDDIHNLGPAKVRVIRARESTSPQTSRYSRVDKKEFHHPDLSQQQSKACIKMQDAVLPTHGITSKVNSL